MISFAQQPLPHNTHPFRWRRDVIAGHLTARSLDPSLLSERAFVKQADLPRSTFRYWQERNSNICDDPVVIKFLESPQGVQFLHAILTGVQFIITIRGGNGVELVCEFLQLTHLDAWIAPSLSAQQRVNACLEASIAQFGDTQVQNLAPTMTPKEITVAQDENFHEAICLVAIEVVSDYILLEQYETKRDKATWDLAMGNALDGLAVSVVQTVSDEAKALLSHAALTLNASHSPDLFHVLHALFSATALSMTARVREAESKLEATRKGAMDMHNCVARLTEEHANLNDLARVNAMLKRSVELCEIANKSLLQLRTWREEFMALIRSLSDLYHPFCLKTGLPITPEQLSIHIDALFTKMRLLASTVELPQHALDGIEKAYRVVPEMIQTFRFFYSTLDRRLKALELKPDVDSEVRQSLIPALYLNEAARKASHAEKRKAIRDTAQALLVNVSVSSSAFAGIEATQREKILEVAKEIALVFQRSSSCVEGRNGYLSLNHHGLHKLSASRLKALRVVHNFYVLDSRGQTPARKFFAQEHEALFEWVLKRMPLPPRPAAKRRTKEEAGLAP